MNLKESYQYQNHLNTMFQDVYGWLLNNSYVTKKKRVHLRTSANPDAQNEETDETLERPFGAIPVNTLIEFMNVIIAERDNVANMINDAKYSLKHGWSASSQIDIDAALSSNKKRNDMLVVLKNMARIKPQTISKRLGQDYKFNNEGNQAVYNYPIEDWTSIDFDRNALMLTLKQIQSEINETSMKAEKAMLDTNVDYSPRFDITDDTLDSIMIWMEKKNETSVGQNN